MSIIITYLLLIFLALYTIISLIDFISSRNVKIFVVEIGTLTIAVMILNFTTDFPIPKQVFGGISPLRAIGIMFAFIIIGMAARYFFYPRTTFSWSSFLRPFFVSPIVLLPLLGTLQRSSDVEPIQLISLAILAFQNGFFWRVIFEKAEKIFPQR